MTHICRAKVADEGTQHYARLCDGSEMQEGDVTDEYSIVRNDFCQECLTQYYSAMEAHP